MSESDSTSCPPVIQLIEKGGVTPQQLIALIPPDSPKPETQDHGQQTPPKTNS